MKILYVVHKGDGRYADYCIRHSFFNYGLTVDKITITVPLALLTTAKFDSCNFDLLQYGERVCIAITGEAIDPQRPLYTAVQSVLGEMIDNGLFREHTADLIRPYIFTQMEIAQPFILKGFMELLKELHFCFSGLEIAFDYFSEEMPFRVLAESSLITVGDTRYTADYRQAKGRATQSSLVCIYNRKEKLLQDSGESAVLPAWLYDIQIWRLEFRIKQDFARHFLSLEALCLNLPGFISSYGQKIKAKADRLLKGVITFKRHHVPLYLEQLTSVQEEDMNGTGELFLQDKEAGL